MEKMLLNALYIVGVVMLVLGVLMFRHISRNQKKIASKETISNFFAEVRGLKWLEAIGYLLEAKILYHLTPKECDELFGGVDWEKIQSSALKEKRSLAIRLRSFGEIPMNFQAEAVALFFSQHVENLASVLGENGHGYRNYMYRLVVNRLISLTPHHPEGTSEQDQSSFCNALAKARGEKNPEVPEFFKEVLASVIRKKDESQTSTNRHRRLERGIKTLSS